MRKKIISVLFCLMATGVLLPSSPSPSISTKSSALSQQSSFSQRCISRSVSDRSIRSASSQSLSSSMRSLTSPMLTPTSLSNELEAPTLPAARLYTATSTRNLLNSSSDTGAEATAIIPSTAPQKTTPFDKKIGTGVFAKQSPFLPDSPVIYQSPSKRLKALESHVNDVEKLRKLYAKTPAGKLKDQIKRTIDDKLTQVKDVYKEMDGNLVEPAPDTPPATDTANKKLKTKIKDFFTAKLDQVKKIYPKKADKTTTPTPTPSYRAALDHSKQKRFDNISKKLAKIDTKLATHNTVPTNEVPPKAVAKRMQAAANWAKGFFEKKLYKTFINEEVSSILGAYNLSDPKQQAPAVEQLTKHLTHLKTLTESSKNLSESNKKQLNTLIAKYQTATKAQITAEQKNYDAIFKQLDTLAGQQASVFKRAIARISDCTSWPQFQAKRAFDSQMNHTNLDLLATGALEKIKAEPDKAKRATKVDEYFATLQKPATKEQEAQLKQLKDYILTDLWTKTTKQTKLEEQVKLVKAWEQYKQDNELWETWNTHKTGQEPKRPKTPGGVRPRKNKIAKLQAKIDAAKELDPTLFAKKGLLQRVRHLTLPLKNKWLRRAAITAAVVVTTAAIAAIVVASHGAALAVALPIIADVGTVAILAHRTVKKADDATGGKLANVAKKGVDAAIGIAKDAAEAQLSAKKKRTHAKANLLYDAITKENGKLRLEDDEGTAPDTKTLTAAEKKDEEARKLAAEIASNDDSDLDFLK